VHRQEKRSLGSLRALFYPSILRRHRHNRFKPQAERPQLFDKLRDRNAVPKIGQDRFDLARPSQVSIEKLNNGPAGRVKPGEILFELGIALGPRADAFLDVVTVSDLSQPGPQQRECFLGDRDLPRPQRRR